MKNNYTCHIDFKIISVSKDLKEMLRTMLAKDPARRVGLKELLNHDLYSCNFQEDIEESKINYDPTKTM